MSNLIHDVYVSIGSNLGPRIYHLNDAVKSLQGLSQGPIECSPVYETRPVGYTDQPDFLNMAAHLRVDVSPRDLLAKLLKLESSHGRTRDIRYGPRTLDLDILLYDDLYFCYRDLQVPHPRMWERAFVIVPLAALLPHRRALGGLTISQLADSLSRKGGIKYVGEFW